MIQVSNAGPSRMRQRWFPVVAAVSCLVACAASPPELGEIERAAAVIATVEQSLEKGDLPGYCHGMYSTDDYKQYLNRVCEAEVRNRLRNADGCTPQHAANQVSRDMAQCNAMTGSGFDAVKLKWRSARTEFIKTAASKGYDGEQILRNAKQARR